MTLEPDDVLTAKDVARLLHMHVKTVQRLADHGGIPAKKIGGEWRFLRSEVEQWLRSK